MKIKPCFYTHDYNPSETIKVTDGYKQKLYILHGLYPCDVYIDQNNILVMIFETKVFV